MPGDGLGYRRSGSHGLANTCRPNDSRLLQVFPRETRLTPSPSRPWLHRLGSLKVFHGCCWRTCSREHHEPKSQRAKRQAMGGMNLDPARRTQERPLVFLSCGLAYVSTGMPVERASSERRACWLSDTWLGCSEISFSQAKDISRSSFPRLRCLIALQPLSTASRSGLSRDFYRPDPQSEAVSRG